MLNAEQCENLSIEQKNKKVKEVKKRKERNLISNSRTISRKIKCETKEVRVKDGEYCAVLLS